jgi:cytochrome bd-type quinol oxidase subunit 1
VDSEIGRQPWIVYDVMKTGGRGVPGPAGVRSGLLDHHVRRSLFVAVRPLLYLLNRKIQAGPEELEEVETVAVGSLPDTFRDVFRRQQPRAGEEPP